MGDRRQDERERAVKAQVSPHTHTFLIKPSLSRGPSQERAPLHAFLPTLREHASGTWSGNIPLSEHRRTPAILTEHRKNSNPEQLLKNNFKKNLIPVR